MRLAGFRDEKTLEGNDFDQHLQQNQKLIRDQVTCRFDEEKVSLLVTGSCGTGKSHIAQALGHCAVIQGIDVPLTMHTKLLGVATLDRRRHGYYQHIQGGESYRTLRFYLRRGDKCLQMEVKTAKRETSQRPTNRSLKWRH